MYKWRMAVGELVRTQKSDFYSERMSEVARMGHMHQYARGLCYKITTLLLNNHLYLKF
jgi:hypothetical protein